MNVLYTVVVIVSGLVGGSFINAYVWRIKKQNNLKTKKHPSITANNTKYSILSGRSICPKCEHKLAPIDLIPIVSWAMLGGKCRYCKHSISVIYPLVELVTVVLFVLSYVYWPQHLSGAGLFGFVFWLVFLVNLLALGLYDLKWLILPNRMVYSLLAFVAIYILGNFIFLGRGRHYLLGLIFGAIIGGGLFYVLYQISSGKWIGGGDVKLGAVLGLILASGLYSALMIFVSSLIGTLIAIPLMASGKLSRKTLIPYGPLLIIGAIITELFAGSIVSWLKTRGYVI